MLTGEIIHVNIIVGKAFSNYVFVPISEEFVFFVMSLANRLQAQWLGPLIFNGI